MEDDDEGEDFNQDRVQDQDWDFCWRRKKSFNTKHSTCIFSITRSIVKIAALVETLI